MLEATGVTVAVVNPKVIADELVLLVAANKAVHARELGRLKTSDVHAEILSVQRTHADPSPSIRMPRHPRSSHHEQHSLSTYLMAPA